MNDTSYNSVSSENGEVACTDNIESTPLASNDFLDGIPEFDDIFEQLGYASGTYIVLAGKLLTQLWDGLLLSTRHQFGIDCHAQRFNRIDALVKG